jgi:hypothetical protein
VSKVDALRALREARYAAAAKQPAVPRPVTRAVPVRAESRPQAPAGSLPTEDEAASVGTCGHRSMNNRTCTRELGHSEKNHRYGVSPSSGR